MIKNTTDVRTKLTNGKLKPGKGKKMTIAVVFLGILALMLIIPSIVLINRGDSVAIQGFIYGIGTLLVISLAGQFQNRKNYDVTFNEDTMQSLNVKYKGKEVYINFLQDDEGLFSWVDSDSKTECIAYKDNSKMGLITKYKIVNYINYLMNSNNLLSKNIDVMF